MDHFFFIAGYVLIGFSIRSVFHGLDLDLVFSGQLDTDPCFWTFESGRIGSVSGSFYSAGSDPVFLDGWIRIFYFPDGRIRIFSTSEG